MITSELSANIMPFIAAYAVTLFFITLYKPKLGLFFLIPAIGLGFGDSSLIKGSFIFVTLLGALLHTFAVGKTYQINRHVFPLIFILGSFALWVLLRCFIVGESFDFWGFWVLKRILAPGVLALLVLFFIRNEKDALVYLWVLISFALLTATVGVLQFIFPDIHFFWTIREVLGVPEAIAYQIFGKIRITGISSYVVPLAYQLLSVFPIILSLCILRIKKGAYVFFCFLVSAILFSGLLLTFIKSGIGGAILGVVVVLVLSLRSSLFKPAAPLLLGVLLISIFCFTVSGTSIQTKIFSLGDTSYERIPIALAAVKTFFAHPFGVGSAYGDHVRGIYSDISNLAGARAALAQFPHNLLLNISVIVGLPALLLVVTFYTFLLQRLWLVYENAKGRRLKILSIGLIGSFSAYLCNAMFHNNNPFFGDAFNWLLIGLALAIINIGLKISSGHVISGKEEMTPVI